MADNDELDQLWRGQPTGPAMKGGDMLTIAMQRAERFDRTIRARNLRECLGAAAVAAFFLFVAGKAPNSLARAGYLLVSASGAWIIFYLLRYGREAAAPAPDRSLKDFQQALVRKYEHQIRLLKRVKYWYLLPPYVGLVLGSAGLMKADIGAGRTAWPSAIAMAVYTAVFGVVWWLNEGPTVRKLRRERERLMREMDSLV